MSGIKAMNFIGTLGIELPSTEIFIKLGDVTALRRNKYGEFYRSNYDRGVLLYALTAKHRPKTILEFGTGRGYGCLCMAWAMEDFDITGHIFTIDIISPKKRFKWPIDWQDGDGPHVEFLARNDILPKVAPPAWLNRIKQLNGFSGYLMSHYDGPSVDMAFIDGGHGYDTVCHDFYSLLQVAADRVGVLFDDYVFRSGYGVKQFVDEEIKPYSSAVTIIDESGHRGDKGRKFETRNHGMVWVCIDTFAFMKSLPLKKQQDIRYFLNSYRRKEQLMILRYNIGSFFRRLTK